jgi:serine/tyrosine/threonine adenylyltransferase
VDAWLGLLQQHQVDFTLAWRRLADAAAGDANPLRALFADPSAVNPWLVQWLERCALDDGATGQLSADGRGDSAAAQARAQCMRQVNPRVIPRNHRVEEALAAASVQGDLAPFKQLLAALRRPFDDDPSSAVYAQPAPMQVTAAYQTFCGT